MSVVLKDGSSKIVLSRGQHSQLQSELSEFKSKTSCNEILLVDKTGITIANVGELDNLQSATLCSLAANNHAANAEIASLIGESSSFSSNLFEGEYSSIYLMNIPTNNILVIVFPRRIKSSKIKKASRKLCESLNEILLSPVSEEDQQIEFKIKKKICENDFNAELMNKLDSIFSV